MVGTEALQLVRELANAPEPEPVAHAVILPNGMTRIWFSDEERGEQWRKEEGIKQELTPLYTAPPAPSVPDEQLQAAFDRGLKAGNEQSVAQQIEIHKLRNSLVVQQQEPTADLARDAERWLSEHDLELLVTFGMQADDCDADGHTLSKEQTRRLCELGVLRNVGFGRSEMTAFGCVLFDQHWEQSRSLPLRTHAEYAALAAEKGGAA